MNNEKEIKSLIFRPSYDGYKRKTILDNEIILSELENPNNLQQKVLELNDLFNLEEFYSEKKFPETAIGIITKKQSIFIECKLIDQDFHVYNFQLLYDALYNPKLDIIPLTAENMWQSKVADDENIVIQLTRFGDFLIWLPENINEFQLSKLKEINEGLKTLISIIPKNEYLKKMFLYIHAWIKLDNEKKLSIDLDDNQLDELINHYTDNKNENNIGKNRK